MLRDVRWMSVKEATALPATQDTVVISVLDQFEETGRPPHLGDFRDHLVLHFVDASERGAKLFWPDEMTPEQHLEACGHEGDEAPVLADAKRIVAFVRTHHVSGEDLRLVVHCHGGVGRSAAIAQWAGSALGLPMPQLGDGVHSLDRANPRVLRLLKKAAGTR